MKGQWRHLVIGWWHSSLVSIQPYGRADCHIATPVYTASGDRYLRGNMVSQQTQDKAYSVFKTLANRAKQYAMNLSEIELKVEEATNNEAWGPTGTLMSGIA